MANVDRPNGLRAVKTLSGAPVSGLIRTIGMGNGEDCFPGDLINLASGLALVADTNDAGILGVAVGFGKFDEAGNIPLGPFNADNLGKRWYDDSESTNTEWVCYYIPADDVIFEVQTSAALTLVVGDTCDLLGTTGNETTGISAHELATTVNADFTVVELPQIVGNDHDLIYGRYWVMVTRAEQAFHA